MISAQTLPSGARAHTLAEYEGIVGAADIGALRTLAKPLVGMRVKMFNGAAVGSSVVEVLGRLTPLLAELGLECRREVLSGGPEVLAATRALRDALQGGPLPVDGPADWREILCAACDRDRRRFTFDDDVIVVHDPQPLPLVEARSLFRGRWLWRCHMDLSHPRPEAWEFVRPFVERYDGAVFSSPAFAQALSIPQYLVFPTIDPLSDKNRELEPNFIRSVVLKFGIDPDRPIVTQVSRFDRLKDPVGVIQAYRLVRRFADCQLVLAGGMPGTDPDGGSILRQVQEAAANDPDIHVLTLPPLSHLDVNALQRASTIVVQKSLREGFGLTVSEALWKKRPVVAAAVGGIPSQVIHKVTGLLVHSIEGAAYQIRCLLANPDLARQLGEQGHQHVTENFLITHNLKRYLMLFLTLNQRARR